MRANTLQVWWNVGQALVKDCVTHGIGGSVLVHRRGLMFHWSPHKAGSRKRGCGRGYERDSASFTQLVALILDNRDR